MTTPPPTPQTLMFDADDTLWENNRVFETVITDFVAWLDHPTLGEPEIREVLHEVETANVAVRGYGTAAFAANLRDVVDRESARSMSDGEIRSAIDSLVQRLAWKTVEIIDGVEETLDELRTRHRLVLLTKGNRREQQLKIDVSGLADRFSETVIVHEKDAATYRRVVVDLELDRQSTWMIGNSPRSDVLPAVAAGLQSVYVPHVWTRAFELAQLPADDSRIIRVETIRGLLDHF